MGQINLYRIDNKKRDEFLDNLYKKFEFQENKVILSYVFERVLRSILQIRNTI